MIIWFMLLSTWWQIRANEAWWCRVSCVGQSNEKLQVIMKLHLTFLIKKENCLSPNHLPIGHRIWSRELNDPGGLQWREGLMINGWMNDESLVDPVETTDDFLKCSFIWHELVLRQSPCSCTNCENKLYYQRAMFEFTNYISKLLKLNKNSTIQKITTHNNIYSCKTATHLLYPSRQNVFFMCLPLDSCNCSPCLVHNCCWIKALATLILIGW